MKKLFALALVTAVLLLIPAATVFSAMQGAWYKPQPGPVFSPGVPGSWDDLDVYSAYVMFNNNKYHMWYSAGGSTDEKSDIGHAVSADGVAWTRDASPVLTHGVGLAWDSQGAGAPAVIYDAADPDPNKRWKMWYAGLSLASGGFQIGYAYSANGTNWTKYSGNPVLAPGPAAWDDASVLSPNILLYGGLYHMWYAGKGDRLQIGYATSPDGVNWSKHAANPVVQLGLTSDWDGGEIAAPSVLFRNNQYEMWYQGGNERTEDVNIGRATSADGVNWVKDGLNPVVGVGPYAWDAHSIYYPSVGEYSGALKMWYHGEQTRRGTLQIGLVVYDGNLVPTPRPAPGSTPTATPMPGVTPGVPTPTSTPNVYGVTINDGAPFTNQVTVTLKLRAPATAPQMMVSNDAGFGGVQWEAYLPEKAWVSAQNSDDAARRTVYVRYGNSAGNILDVVQDDIGFDDVAPIGNVTVLKMALEAANGGSNTLLLYAEDNTSGVGSMRLSNAPDFAGAFWEPYVSAQNWMFDEHGIAYVQYFDRAGNVSEIYQALLADAKDPSLFLPLVSR